MADFKKLLSGLNTRQRIALDHIRTFGDVTVVGDMPGRMKGRWMNSDTPIFPPHPQELRQLKEMGFLVVGEHAYELSAEWRIFEAKQRPSQAQSE